MDEIGKNALLSTKTPLFVDDTPEKNIMSTKTPHFVDGNEKKADNYSKKDSAKGRSLVYREGESPLPEFIRNDESQRITTRGSCGNRISQDLRHRPWQPHSRQE